MRRSEIDPAVQAGILTASQADRLIEFLSTSTETPRFSFVHVLYYLGGMIAIGAMSLFMTLAWSRLGGWGGAITACFYILFFLSMTHWFNARPGLYVPAGIMATLAVVTVPLAIFSLQMALGHWQGGNYRDYHVWIDWRWIFIELGTLAAGAILLWRYRFPFMLMPIAVTLWYMSMDLVPFLYGDREWINWDLRRWVSLWFGLATIAFAFLVDLRSRDSRDYAFWLYLFGVIAFWGGLSLMKSDSEVNKAIYCGINVVMILTGAILGRRVFAVFGGFGVAFYLGHLAHQIFRDSLLFPFALTLIGLAVIAMGVMWQRREKEWSSAVRGILPGEIRKLLEARAER